MGRTASDGAQLSAVATSSASASRRKSVAASPSTFSNGSTATVFCTTPAGTAARLVRRNGTLRIAVTVTASAAPTAHTRDAGRRGAIPALDALEIRAQLLSARVTEITNAFVGPCWWLQRAGERKTGDRERASCHLRRTVTGPSPFRTARRRDSTRRCGRPPRGRAPAPATCNAAFRPPCRLRPHSDDAWSGDSARPELRQSEVEDLRVAVGTQHDVLGLDVAMHEPRACAAARALASWTPIQPRRGCEAAPAAIGDAASPPR